MQPTCLLNVVFNCLPKHLNMPLIQTDQWLMRSTESNRHDSNIFYGNLPNCVDHMKTWGTAGTATAKSKASGKLNDRETVCMFVGHAKDHAGDTCSMWSKNTGKARVTRDVIWLHRMCFPTPPNRPEASLSYCGLHGAFQ